MKNILFYIVIPAFIILIIIAFTNTVMAAEKKQTKEIVDIVNERLSKQAEPIDTKSNEFIIQKSNYLYAKKHLQALIAE